MKNYRKQGSHMIENLKREIEIIELADAIIEKRISDGKDRLPFDISGVISLIKELSCFDDASIYSILVNREAL